MKLVSWVERQNLRFAIHGNPCVYDNATFPWALEIERQWLTIRGELAKVMMRKDALPGFHEISSDVATISTDRDWKTFLLAGYGFRSERNIEMCPETWRILQNVPGLVTAMNDACAYIRSSIACSASSAWSPNCGAKRWLRRC